nr:integrase, catalytic region, zinc finger, CCHC-type, peptidase aspartic, catalytic [Tanacetum cinerariifolium]
MVNSSFTGLVHTARTRKPWPKGITRNDRAPYASKSSEAKKNVIVEDHRRNLSLSKNHKTMSSERNNIKLAIQNDKSKIVYGTCKQCFVTANHDACLLSSVNALNSRANNLCANVVQICLWCVDSGCSKHMTENIKLLIDFIWKFLGTVHFGNDHIAAILGYGDLKWGNITITKVYFVEGLGHNLFLVGQFCDADLEVTFRRNTCFIRYLDGVDLLKDNYSRYTWFIFSEQRMEHQKVYNWRTNKIMETMNITFRLELTYAPSTITPQKPSECDLDVLFKPFHHEYLGGRPSEAPRTVPAAPVIQNLQAPTTSMAIQDSAPTPKN